MDAFGSLKNKVAVITGASSGIGLATSRSLAGLGCKTIMVGRNRENLVQAKELLSKENLTVWEYAADVSDLNAVEAFKDYVLKEFGGLDYLINNAGIAKSERLGEVSVENFDDLVSANLKSVYLCSVVLGHSLMRENGSIVNVSSIRARTGTPTFSSAYAASKAGVVNMTKSLAFELAKKCIRVNCVAPGATFPTEMSKGMTTEQRRALAEAIPLGRLAIPDDVANSIVFLLSDMASYITGHTLDVNGGAWMN